MRIIDRLMAYLRARGISAYSFERSCAVANGYLRKQEKGKGSIGSDILERIIVQYRDLNLNWLLSGKGEMLIEKEHQVQESQEIYTREEHIRALADRIRLLESALADKEKIIDLLERHQGNKKPLE